MAARSAPYPGSQSAAVRRDALDPKKYVVYSCYVFFSKCLYCVGIRPMVTSWSLKRHVSERAGYILTAAEDTR
jgi:hypothetical protein